LICFVEIKIYQDAGPSPKLFSLVRIHHPYHNCSGFKRIQFVSYASLFAMPNFYFLAYGLALAH
jgi:hypothetical protein